MTLGGISRCNQIINILYYNSVMHYSVWILYYNVHKNETTFVNFWHRSYFHITTGEVYLLKHYDVFPIFMQTQRAYF